LPQVNTRWETKKNSNVKTKLGVAAPAPAAAAAAAAQSCAAAAVVASAVVASAVVASAVVASAVVASAAAAAAVAPAASAAAAAAVSGALGADRPLWILVQELLSHVGSIRLYIYTCLYIYILVCSCEPYISCDTY
jgi:hypothetical protein